MADYKVGQKILIKTSYRDKDGKLILAGRPGVIVDMDKGYSPNYKVEVQMPDGPYVISLNQARGPERGFLLDTPENRAKYPIPNWEQIDLEELHWPKLMSPTGIRVRSDAFDGFISKIAQACGAIDATETDISVTYSPYHWGNLEYANENEKKIYAFPSEARAKAFWELLKWIDWYGKTEYGAGVEKGHNLLLQLNQGELTIDMFNQKVEEESRLRSYEQHPWKQECEVKK
jgi:hypothetical protein